MGKKKIGKITHISKAMAERIPYECVYEEEGLFEAALGDFSKAYELRETDKGNRDMVGNLAVRQFAKLLNAMPEDMTMQFLVYNRLIPIEEFLKDVLVVPEYEEKVNRWINKYNQTLAENCDIGHNNVKKQTYLVLSVHRDTPEEAVQYIKSKEGKLKELFEELCGVELISMTASERVKLMYSMFHPGAEDFERRIGFPEGENILLSDLRERGLGTKDCIAPSAMDTSHRDYLILNGNAYARAFFITSLPVSLSNSLINDITNISSNMILSCLYEPMDARYGFEAAAEMVSENVVIRESAKRDTIGDRRERAVIRREVMLEENEERYAEKAALKTFERAVAGEERAMLCTFVIVIYAEELEILNRDSELLHISTSKFACQVKCLDLQQMQGLQSALPLCINRIDAKRVLQVSRLAAIPPFRLSGAGKGGGQFAGLNAINDNLILYNRKDGKNMAGMIAGVEHSGKTFQCKREIFNALVSTTDRVVVLSDSDGYGRFIRELGGVEGRISGVNPFEMREHYGLVNADIFSKSIMLEALLEAVFKEQEVSSHREDMENEGETGNSLEGLIAEEVELLMKCGLDFAKADAAVQTIFSNMDQLPLLCNAAELLEAYMNGDEETVEARLMLYRFHGAAELILCMDQLFNRMIRDSSRNITTWVFIDSIDLLLASDQAAAFLSDYVEKMNALQNVLTFVVQSSVRLFTDQAATFRLEELVGSLGYYKLLNQGAIERKKYSELLNISNSLVNHLTGAELGKGVIFTPFSNVAFDDNFVGENEGDQAGFYELFKI